MVLGKKTKNTIGDLINVEDLFDISNLDPKNELLSNKNKKKYSVNLKLKLLKVFG